MTHLQASILRYALDGVPSLKSQGAAEGQGARVPLLDTLDLQVGCMGLVGCMGPHGPAWGGMGRHKAALGGVGRC